MKHIAGIRIRYTLPLSPSLSPNVDNLPNEIEICSDEFQVYISFSLTFWQIAWWGHSNSDQRERIYTNVKKGRFEIVNNLLPVMWWTFFLKKCIRISSVSFFLSISISIYLLPMNIEHELWTKCGDIIPVAISNVLIEHLIERSDV